MNRYNLNMSINSIMLLSTYGSTQSTQKDDSNDSIKSISQLNECVDFFENVRFRRPVLGYFESIQLIHSYQ